MRHNRVLVALAALSSGLLLATPAGSGAASCVKGARVGPGANSSTVVRLCTGPRGKRGSRGPRGFTGPVGPQGPPGPSKSIVIPLTTLPLTSATTTEGGNVGSLAVVNGVHYDALCRITTGFGKGGSGHVRYPNE